VVPGTVYTSEPALSLSTAVVRVYGQEQGNMLIRRQSSHAVRLTLVAALLATHAAGVTALYAGSPSEGSETRHPDSAVRRAMALLPSGVSAPVEVINIGRFPRLLRVRLERSCTFILVGVERIYINESCPVYLNAEWSVLDTLKLAALLRHEQAHLHGADEANARSTEVATFRALLQSAPAEYQTPGMVYAATLERLAHTLRARRQQDLVASTAESACVIAIRKRRQAMEGL
jgi:hypothetical protein